MMENKGLGSAESPRLQGEVSQVGNDSNIKFFFRVFHRVHRALNGATGSHLSRRLAQHSLLDGTERCPGDMVAGQEAVDTRCQLVTE